MLFIYIEFFHIQILNSNTKQWMKLCLTNCLYTAKELLHTQH